MALEESYIRRVEIPHHVRKYIETELKMYKAYLSAIHLIDEELGEIYQAQLKKEGPPVQGGELSNPPLSIALRIDALESEKKDKLSRIRKIEEGLKLFPVGSLGRRIIEVRYFSGMDWTHEQVMAQVGMGKRSSYFERLAFIHRSFGIVFKIL